MKLWNIPHVTKKRNILTPRNRLGQFCLSNKLNESVTTSTTHNSSKNNKFPENPPDIGDEWETINLNESDKKNYRNRK